MSIDMLIDMLIACRSTCRSTRPNAILSVGSIANRDVAFKLAVLLLELLLLLKLMLLHEMLWLLLIKLLLMPKPMLLHELLWLLKLVKGKGCQRYTFYMDIKKTKERSQWLQEEIE